MSWHLDLKPSRGSVRTFIGAMRHALRRTGLVTADDGQFDYWNPDTGVYFTIDTADPDETSAPDGPEHPDDEESAPATLTVNFVRPSPFGREAARVLAGVARDVPLWVRDPQSDGIWETLDVDRLAESYRSSNLRATRAVRDHVDASDIGHPVPTALLHYAWEWNIDRASKDARRKRDGRNLWVPKYEFVRIDKRVYSYVNWIDGVATLFPKTELVGITRNKYQLRSKGIFGRKRPSLTFVPRSAIEGILDRTYRPDPIFADALSPIVDGGVAGQQMFLERSRDQNAVTDPIYLDENDYARRETKPFERLAFDRLIDADA